MIISSLQPVEPEISKNRLNEIFQRINQQTNNRSIGTFGWLRYAAGILIIIAIGGLIWNTVQPKDRFPVRVAIQPAAKGKIILANGEIREFDTEQTTIKQTATGDLTINNDTIKNQPTNEKVAMNQVIIPFGMRSDITLADGTHIWLNSGSQLSYPTEFVGNTREVHLSG